ncbi:MAG: glyceraldehyde 3-phosphate dehydrogenase NAD-binding domain-containing protein, partial [Candidatus Amoebophilus sp.]
MNIAINGFGRIGKNFFRVLLEDSSIRDKVKIIAINIGPANPEDLPYFIKYDSILPTYKKEVYYQDGYLYCDNQKIAVIAETDISKINWGQYNIDWIVE